MSVTAAMLALVVGTPTMPPPPSLPPREFRAVWVATVDNIDWPSKEGLPTAKAQAELVRIMDKAKELNLNAVIFQVRPSADALYDSKLEPWSEFLTGKQGQAPKPYWDPLKFAVDEAHKRGIELHCWFNPYRALHPAQKGPVSANHISRTNPGVVKQYGKYLWMDPGEPLVQRRTLEVMLDVVNRYDIDGIHIDDYFYPYKEKGPDGQIMDFPDGSSFSRLDRRSLSGASRGDWRRQNVDNFIQQLYQEVKKSKPWVKVGISPFGIYRPGFPQGIKAGVDQYDDLYADVLKWYQKGWCDYLTPQLYWPIKQTAQAYPTLLKWWAENNPAKRHFWPGNFTSRTSPNDGNWPAAEVVNQIALTRKMPGAEGNVHFSMKAFMANYNGIATALKTGPYKNAALIPASPWLGALKPQAPSVTVNDERLDWPTDEDVRFYALSLGVEEGGKIRWSPWKVTDQAGFSLDKKYQYAAICAISRTGVASDVTVAGR